MGKYAVELKPSARKELGRLPASLIERIFPKLEGLAFEPRPAGCKKLKGGQREWRIRIGNYRVVYTVDDEKLLVSVMRIRHRSEVYDG
ncbi:MAG: type II toxin-antitoxin system RelE/ParE family toxin [Acidobacteriota bacterium]|nr:type II toxin-antitoxin system RelE/ParE family toxin [Acidobacteriota bacterium]